MQALGGASASTATAAQRCASCAHHAGATGLRRLPLGAFSRPVAQSLPPFNTAAAGPSRRQVLGSVLLSSGGLWLAGRGGSSIAAAAAVSAKEKVLLDPKWPDKWPFRPEDFLRYDESDDSVFYETPRFVYHIDEDAVKALTEFYTQSFPASGQDDVALLDICSSWTSHYPPGYKAGRIVALGMNEEELASNKQVSEYVVHDLNLEPALPFENDSFDVITNAVSVDYLNKPLEVFQEMHRVLKPGGVAYMSFSNRCFPTKAIALWTATGDEDHVWIVGSYFHYSVPGGFDAPAAKDITPKGGLFGKSDPMFVVFARKAGGAEAPADAAAAPATDTAPGAGTGGAAAAAPASGSSGSGGSSSGGRPAATA